MHPQIWAHRGASADAPENTLEACALAAQQGAYGVELDVHLSGDGIPVVIHDASLDRVSDQRGLVALRTVHELKQADVAHTHPKWNAPARIPTLEEVYALLRPTPLAINVELKGALAAADAFEQTLLLLERRMGMRGRVHYTSFNPYRLMALRARDSAASIGLLCFGGWLDVEQYALRLGAQALHPPVGALEEKGFAARCHALGLALHVWGTERDAQLRLAAQQGVQAIVTDHPAYARAFYRTWWRRLSSTPLHGRNFTVS